MLLLIQSNNERDDTSQTPEKRKPYLGRITSVCKELKLQSHEMGDDCNCKRLKCFQQVSEAERSFLLRRFNLLCNNNEQNRHLTSLITVNNIRQRKPRQDEDRAALHDASYRYRVRVKRNEKMVEVPVCPIYGVTRGKIEYIVQKSLKSTGQPPQDALARIKTDLERYQRRLSTKLMLELVITAWKKHRKSICQKNLT
jgi:hypothetical protein